MDSYDDELEDAPTGWADPYGNRYDLHTFAAEHPRRTCRVCRDGGLTLTGCYDLAGGKRTWVYTCKSESCRREHVFLPERGLFALEVAEDDDTDFDGVPVPLETAGDPL